MTGCEWRHAPEARRGLWRFEESFRVEEGCQNGCVKGSGSRLVIPQSAATDLLWQTCAKQPDLTPTPSPPKGSERKDTTKVNFLNYSDHSWIKTTAIFFPLTSSLSISFSADFFFYSTKRWSYGTLIVFDLKSRQFFRKIRTVFREIDAQHQLLTIRCIIKCVCTKNLEATELFVDFF